MTQPGQGQPFNHLPNLCKVNQQTKDQNPEDRLASLCKGQVLMILLQSIRKQIHITTVRSGS